MRYLSLCSGIEAASVAWQPLGWQPVAFAEIDPFCCALLEHYFPEVPNLGDIKKITGAEIIARCGQPDLIVAGTPCQSFSVAGRRLGLSDPRGNVTLHFLRLVGEIGPDWVVWENVPGVLSDDKGRTFRQVISTLAELGYGVAWRVLDAQYFGVPQRRRRVFLVGHRGDWRGPAGVLFDAQGGERAVAPGGETRTGDPGAGADSTDQRGSGCVGERQQGRIAATLEANYSRMFSGSDFCNLVAGTVSAKWHKGSGGPAGDEMQNLVCARDAVRRFTPRECERLQGFPDDWTLIRWNGRLASNTQRYKAIGNSMAVPVVRWIGRRILQTIATRTEAA